MSAYDKKPVFLIALALLVACTSCGKWNCNRNRNQMASFWGGSFEEEAQSAYLQNYEMPSKKLYFLLLKSSSLIV